MARGAEGASRPITFAFNGGPGAEWLQHALGVLMARLAPIEAADEKLMVLGKLASSLPGPVSKVLLAVIDDLSRLSGKR